jgi:voltage-gated potassium channel
MFMKNKKAKRSFRRFLQNKYINHKSKTGKIVDAVLAFLNLVFLIILFLEFHPGFSQSFPAVEVSLACVLLTDYFLRVYGSENRKKYVLGVHGLINIITILPTFLLLLLPGLSPNLRLIKLVKYSRVLRVFRFVRYRKYF